MLERASDVQRDSLLVHLRELVGRGTIELDHFEVLAVAVTAAVTVDDLAEVMATVPPIVPMTAQARRLAEPLRLKTGTGTLEMRGRWQVGKTTKALVGTGKMVLDLTEAELDDREIELTVDVATGRAEVIVPNGIDVQLVRVSGSVKNKLGVIVALPGAPRIRISANTATGTIVLCRPRPPKRRWWRRRRRS